MFPCASAEVSDKRITAKDLRLNYTDFFPQQFKAIEQVRDFLCV